MIALSGTHHSKLRNMLRVNSFHRRRVLIRGIATAKNNVTIKLIKSLYELLTGHTCVTNIIHFETYAIFADVVKTLHVTGMWTPLDLSTNQQNCNKDVNYCG